MASRRMGDLSPDTQEKAHLFLQACKFDGVDVAITCTYRSTAEQAELYAIGRTVPGKKVTNARPGQSLHNCTSNGVPAARAFDVVPLRNGKAVWDAKDPLWERVGELGESVGLEWGGRWKFKDRPHFQAT